MMYESRIVGRPFWAWFEHRVGELYRPNILIADRNVTRASTSKKNVQIEHSLYPGIMCRKMGGVSTIYSFENFFQLLPVAIKGICDISAATNTKYCDFYGIL